MVPHDVHDADALVADASHGSHDDADDDVDAHVHAVVDVVLVDMWVESSQSFHSYSQNKTEPEAVAVACEAASEVYVSHRCSCLSYRYALLSPLHRSHHHHRHRHRSHRPH